jgi:hypothetical protein
MTNNDRPGAFHKLVEFLRRPTELRLAELLLILLVVVLMFVAFHGVLG